MVVVVDDADRENEGDLTIAAQFATPEAVNFMATHGSRADLPLLERASAAPSSAWRQMTEHNETPYETAFTVTVRGPRG